MGRSPCCSKVGLNRGAWTALEDKILTDYVRIHGECNWRDVPKRAGLKRCGKSCRLRWLNYLKPGIKRGNISQEEEDLIIRLHKLLGNRWSLIAGRLPGRTDNEIKNYWNTNLSKKIQGHHQTLGLTDQKHSNQCDEEKLKKQQQQQQQQQQKKKKTMKTTTRPSLINSHVVRTKASRCNRVILTPQQNSNQQVAENNKAEEVEPFKNKALESDFYDGLSSFNQVEEEDSPNLMIDLDFCFSDFLNSDLFDFGNGEAGDSIGNSHESFPSWDQPVHCPEEDWTRSHGIEPDFPSITSLLSQVENWLGK